MAGNYRMAHKFIGKPKGTRVATLQDASFTKQLEKIDKLTADNESLQKENSKKTKQMDDAVALIKDMSKRLEKLEKPETK